jgi:hypothetical protein
MKQHLTFSLSFFVLLCCCSILATPAQAANHYVRNGAAGAGNGSDWANAYTTLPNSLTRGDVYYIADGTYPGHNFSDSAAGTTLITIKKATAADHGTDTGWVATYGDGQAAFSSAINFTTRYYVFDGQVGGGPATTLAAWTTGYGFKVTESSSTPVIFVQTNSGNVDVSHVEAVGAGRNGSAGGTGNDGMQVFAPLGPVTLSHAYLHDLGRCVFFVYSASLTNDFTVSYTYTGPHESTAGEHSEMTVLHNAAKFTFRWGVITHAEGTGGVIAGDDAVRKTAEIYGNIIYDFPNGSIEGGNNGFFADDSAGASANWKIYNNTFIGIDSDVALYGTCGQGCTSNVAQNNFYYTTTANKDASGWGTQSFAHFQDSGAASGSSATTGTGNPFLDMPNWDFRLRAATPAGAQLAAPYNVDMFGNVRGADGGWDRGAIEFSPAPQPPGNVRIETN